MKDKTKKWLAIAGLLAVCAVLVFGISRVLYHEPDREAQAVERESEETELFVETETPEPVQAESTEAETEEPRTSRIHRRPTRRKNRRNRLRQRTRRQRQVIPKTAWYMWKASDGLPMKGKAQAPTQMTCMKMAIKSESWIK